MRGQVAARARRTSLAASVCARLGRRARQRRARDARRDGASSCSARGARAQRSSASRSRTAADLRAVDRRSVRDGGGARGARQRRALGRGRDAVRRRPARPRLHVRDRRGGQHVRRSSATDGTARGCPSGATTCAPTYRKGIGAAGNVKAGRARAAARPAARREGRRQPVGGRGRRRPGAGGSGARVDPARRPHARPRRLAARLRGLRARVQRRRQGAGRRAAAARRAHDRRHRRLRPAATASDDLATALRTYGDPRVQVHVARRHDGDVPARAQGRGRPGARGEDGARRGRGGAARRVLVRRARLRRSPSSSRRSTRRCTRSRASSRSTSTGSTAASTPGLADRLLAQQPAVGAGGTAIPAGVLVLDGAPLDWLELLTVSGTGLYTTEEVYRLLPSVYRIRDAEQGGVLRELVDLIDRPGQRARREPRAALRRPVHRDVRRLGGAVHRRPDRLPNAARRRARGRLAAGRGREHDPASAAARARCRCSSSSRTT